MNKGIVTRVHEDVPHAETPAINTQLIRSLKRNAYKDKQRSHLLLNEHAHVHSFHRRRSSRGRSSHQACGRGHASSLLMEQNCCNCTHNHPAECMTAGTSPVPEGGKGHRLGNDRRLKHSRQWRRHRGRPEEINDKNNLLANDRNSR